MRILRRGHVEAPPAARAAEGGWDTVRSSIYPSIHPSKRVEKTLLEARPL